MEIEFELKILKSCFEADILGEPEFASPQRPPCETYLSILLSLQNEKPRISKASRIDYHVN